MAGDGFGPGKERSGTYIGELRQLCFGGIHAQVLTYLASQDRAGRPCKDECVAHDWQPNQGVGVVGAALGFLEEEKSRLGLELHWKFFCFHNSEPRPCRIR
jgi:hypothetical protein